jgi:hypothetical protein
MKTYAWTVCLGLGLLLLGGCGEKVASEAQRAVDQVKAEASKMASEKMESLSTGAIEQLKKMQGQNGKEKSEDKSANQADEKIEK